MESVGRDDRLLALRVAPGAGSLRVVGIGNVRDLFLLDPTVTFLNHGSFGACPRPVFEEYQHWQRELELQPVEFLGRRFDGLMNEARAKLADYLNVPAGDLVFVPNATSGVNVDRKSVV